MSEATMTVPEDQHASDAVAAPVSHTGARHTALATVAEGIVFYDREQAAWSMRPSLAQHERAIRGSEQRTLRDLRDLGLIEYREQSGPARVYPTTRGQGALVLWGDRQERLQGTE